MLCMDIYVLDKFDQFWAINRRLMESHGDNEGFKHIPIRIYSDDGSCFQRLVSPKNVDGSRKVLQQMIAELYPDKINSKKFIHTLKGIEWVGSLLGTHLSFDGYHKIRFLLWSQQ